MTYLSFNWNLLCASVDAIKALALTVDGICTFVELSAPLTARLCEQFQVSGHSPQSVEMARDKYLTRKAVANTDSTAKCAVRNYLVKDGSTAELQRAAASVGFPAVLKPVSGAASLGVQKVTNMDELVETYHKTCVLVSELIVSSGALERKVTMESTDSNEDLKTNVSSLNNTAIVLEEYIAGQEVDIDIVLCDGEMTYCEISDNGPTVEPYFGETWNCCPTLLSEEAQAEMREMALSITVDALGFESGVFHVEGKYSPNGPRLIEVNCRMGGGPVRGVQILRSNVDLVVEQILLSVGLPSVPPAIPVNERKAIGFVDVNARKSGSIGNLDFVAECFANRPGMVYVKPFITPGEHIVGPEEGQPTWLAEAVFIRDTPAEAQRDAIELNEEMQGVFESHYL